LSTKSASAAVAKERYPDGWEEVPMERLSSGLILEDENDHVIGYAIYEPEKRYVADLAVRKDADPTKTLLLLKRLFQAINTIGGEWKADCRESSSYKLLQLVNKRGLITITADEETDEMGDESMHEVSFLVLSRAREHAH
jgi:hypothetical protein